MNLWTFLSHKQRLRVPERRESFPIDPIHSHLPPAKMSNLTTPVIPNLLIKTTAYRYRATIKGWKHIHLDKADDSKCPSQVRIITWNINYDEMGVVERLDAALRHLETDVLGCKNGEDPEPCCILLQELNAMAFPHLLADPWVRAHFVVVPKSPEKWPARAVYGNVTLVSRATPIVACSIMHFASSIFQRTGVIVDVRLNDSAKNTNGSRGSTSVVRVVNTHLESLPPGLPARRLQLEVLSKLLFVGGERCGGIIAGDMNAIGPNEHEYPAELGLRDAWSKSEETKDGHTWGYQGPSQYPAGRLDKMLYLPLDEYEVDTPKRVGMGVIVKNLESGDNMQQFVSDHYGLDTTLRMVG
ncbi:hypothetical protein AX14_006181 [Amanita brunnescens Koide BX004]|nr:hypothetical protein AX14_006181 [Amanita brunnescens Koide BX004]